MSTVLNLNEFEVLKHIEKLLKKDSVNEDVLNIDDKKKEFVSALNEKLLRGQGRECHCCNGSGVR